MCNVKQTTAVELIKEIATERGEEEDSVVMN